MRSILRAGVLLWIPALFISCDLLPRKAVDPASVRAPMPARNEFYLAGTDRLTLSEFEALRSEFPKVSANDLVKMALDAQVLARDWRAHGDGNALREAVRCVRILRPPSVAPAERKEALALLSRAFGISRWEDLESRLREARQTREVLWNPDLVREYGIDASS